MSLPIFRRHIGGSIGCLMDCGLCACNASKHVLKISQFWPQPAVTMRVCTSIQACQSKSVSL